MFLKYMLMFPEVTAAAVVAFHVIFSKGPWCLLSLPVFPNSSFHPILCLTHLVPSGTFPHFITLCSFFSALKEVWLWPLTLFLVSKILLMKNSHLKIQSLDAHMRTNMWHLSFSVRVSSFIIWQRRKKKSFLELTGSGKGFLNRTSVVQALKPTTDNRASQTEMCWHGKGQHNSSEKADYRVAEIFTSYTSRIYKELKRNLNISKQPN